MTVTGEYIEMVQYLPLKQVDSPAQEIARCVSVNVNVSHAVNFPATFLLFFVHDVISYIFTRYAPTSWGP